VDVIEIILDNNYFEKIKEIRSMVESEIGLTLNYLPIVHFSNIEIIALILGILAIITYIPIATFTVLWVFVGSFIIYQTIQDKARSEKIRLQLGLRKIRSKKKLNYEFDFDIDIPKRYRTFFSDIALLIRKIRLIKFHKEKEGEIEKTNDFLWASAFSMNAFNHQVGYWVVYLTMIILYLFCLFENFIQFNLIFVIFWIVQIVAFWYVSAMEGNFRFFVLNDFKRHFLFIHIVWILSIFGQYCLLFITYFQVIFQLITLQNLILIGLVGLLEYFVIMLSNDLFTSFIISGIMNDKLQGLLKLKKTLDFQIYHKDRLIENPDIYFYDYLITKRYKPIKWRFLVFGKYILEPDLTEDDIRLLSKSPLHFEILQGEVGMKGLFVTNKEILKRYGYED